MASDQWDDIDFADIDKSLGFSEMILVVFFRSSTPQITHVFEVHWLCQHYWLMSRGLCGSNVLELIDLNLIGQRDSSTTEVGNRA